MSTPKTDSSNVIDWNSIRGGAPEAAIYELERALGERVKHSIFPTCAAAFYRHSQQAERQSLATQFGRVSATVSPLLGGGLRLELMMNEDDIGGATLLTFEAMENPDQSDYGFERTVPGTFREFQFIRREIALTKVFGSPANITQMVRVVANRIAANPTGYPFSPAAATADLA